VFDRQTGGGLAIVVPGSKRSTKRVHAVRRTNMKPDYHSMATEGRARMVLKVCAIMLSMSIPPQWGAVYLDNAKASEECSGMEPTRFRWFLSHPSRQGLYQPIDAAWGRIKLSTKL